MLRNARFETITLKQKNRKSTRISKLCCERVFALIVAKTRLRARCNFARDRRVFIAILLSSIFRNLTTMSAYLFLLLFFSSKKSQIQSHCF